MNKITREVLLPNSFFSCDVSCVLRLNHDEEDVLYFIYSHYTLIYGYCICYFCAFKWSIWAYSLISGEKESEEYMLQKEKKGEKERKGKENKQNWTTKWTKEEMQEANIVTLLNCNKYPVKKKQTNKINK